MPGQTGSRVTYQTILRMGQRAIALTEVADDLEPQIAAVAEDMALGSATAQYGWTRPPPGRSCCPGHASAESVRGGLRRVLGHCPVPVSSGRTDRRRHNRLGDRQLNPALHPITVGRMHGHPPTRVYTERRRAEDNTDREICRCVNCYLPLTLSPVPPGPSTTCRT